MIATGLFSVCGLALLVVFALLAFLALVMRLITEFFPEREAALDSAVAAAVAAAVHSVYPGARVTKIEEES